MYFNLIPHAIHFSGRSFYIIMVNKFYQIVTLSLAFILLHLPFAFAATLGPAETFEDLCAMIDEASSGDTLLISGEIDANEDFPLTTHSPLRITSQYGEIASLKNLRLHNASITFSNVLLQDTLSVSGNSNICLSNGVHILGSEGESALSFIGNGTLIVEPHCQITAHSGGEGIFISHTGGEFYGSIEGSVQGGSGQNGGAGVVISPLLGSSAMLISGSITGGNGTSLGGHALNLFNLSGNAFVTVDGTLTGGSGFIGGDAIQIISAADTVNIGIGGSVKGGSGHSHGGCALILMNASGSSSFNLFGSLSGGDAIGKAAQPGTSLHLVGDSAVVRTRIDNCMLEDGRYISSTPKPEATETSFKPISTPSPTPSPTPQVSPKLTPMPEITAPAENIAYIITPEPPAEPVRYHAKETK